MLLDFEVQRSTRRCAATDRLLEPGEVCFSLLEVQGAKVVRTDYCEAAWANPPESALGWWKTRIPEPTAKKIKLAPNEVLLGLFDEMADRQDQEDLRYVLTLLLIRRRVLRLSTPGDELAIQPSRSALPSIAEIMFVYCPRRDATYEVPVAMPGETRMDEIQQQLSELLVAGAE
jgi:hypothetical protein